MANIYETKSMTVSFNKTKVNDLNISFYFGKISYSENFVILKNGCSED